MATKYMIPRDPRLVGGKRRREEISTPSPVLHSKARRVEEKSGSVPLRVETLLQQFASRPSINEEQLKRDLAAMAPQQLHAIAQASSEYSSYLERVGRELKTIEQAAAKVEFDKQSSNAKIVRESLLDFTDYSTQGVQCTRAEKEHLERLSNKLTFVTVGSIDDFNQSTGHRNRGFRTRLSFKNSVGTKLRIEFVAQMKTMQCGPLSLRFNLQSSIESEKALVISSKPASKRPTRRQFLQLLDRYQPGIVDAVRPHIIEAYLVDMLSRSEEMSKSSVGVSRLLRLFVE